MAEILSIYLVLVASGFASGYLFGFFNRLTKELY